jgi:hypothetical protein
MVDLDRKMALLDMLPSSELWPEIESRSTREAALPDKRYASRILVASFALVLFAATFVWAIHAMGFLVPGRSSLSPASGSNAGASSRSVSPRQSGQTSSSPGAAGIGEPLVVRSSPEKLVVDWPQGAVEWSFTSNDCSVAGRSLVTGATPGNFGGSCGGNPYLGWGLGGLGVDGQFYQVLYGRTLPEGAVIRLTMTDGTTMTVQPNDGLWMFVVPSSGDLHEGFVVSRIEAINSEGKVLASADVHPVAP